VANVTYVGDEPREVSMLPSGTLRLVKPDEKFRVPDSVAISYACQPHFFEVEDYPWPPNDDPNDDDTGPSVDELTAGFESDTDETSKGK
jgi:hypothetical protein